MQTRRSSALEAVANVAVGYWLSVGTQMLTFPLMGIQTTSGQNLAIGAVFTVVSLVRSYALRRLFNRAGKSPGS